MAKTRSRNYAATDATLINVRKLKKDLEAIRMELDALGARVRNLEGAQPAPAPETSAENDPPGQV